MKLIGYSPEGVLENTIKLVGYERLCYLLNDDEKLVFDIFEAISTRLVQYYQIVARHKAIGACIVNDDWGFKTQTLFSPRAMRRFVFPWQKKIVSTIHEAGKPAILHSCGHFERIIDDIAEDMQFDARHSYEDAILPIEEAYERYHQRIAILGGIDVDFICRSRPEEVYLRSRAMLDRAKNRGGYALGTGNSVPDYVPDVGYFAMLQAALEER
jgi:uroporphyrinogen decarboxylase